MEQIARKFFEDESLLRLELGPDGVVGFLASNYVEVLGIYRAMVKQNEATCKKKEKAHQQVKIAQRVIAKAKNKTIPKEFVLKYSIIVEALDIIDAAARKPLGKGANFLGKVATWPLKKVIMFTIICMGTKPSSGKEVLAGSYLLFESLPDYLEQRISNIDPGITEGSNHPEHDELKLQEVKIAY